MSIGNPIGYLDINAVVSIKLVLKALSFLETKIYVSYSYLNLNIFAMVKYIQSLAF